MIIKEFLVKKRWIILSFSLGLAALSTSAYLMYREFFRPKSASNILETYGTLFRQVIEVEELNQILQSRKQITVGKTKNRINDTCTVSCSNTRNVQKELFNDGIGIQISNNSNLVNSSSSNDTSSIRNKRAVGDDVVSLHRRELAKEDYTYHGCCKTRQQYNNFTSLKHPISRKVLRIVQFKKRKQYFLQDVCQHVKSCNRSCDCRQQMITAVALVVDGRPTDEDLDENGDDNFDDMNARLEYVEYEGWCKCFNK